MRESEAFLRAFHAANAGITSRVFARAGTYARIAERVPAGRVLDLGCGNGPILSVLGHGAIGIDLSFEELAAGHGGVQARAQEMPFADAAFDAVTCHLAFMLFDEIELVVAELSRVLKRGAPFIALLGGGPTAEGRDAFHAFAERVGKSASLGDRRASSETGWRELFANWSGDITFERWPVDLSGTFDEVWSFLSASYQLRAEDAPAIRDALRAEFPGEHVPCTVVTFCATVRR